MEIKKNILLGSVFLMLVFGTIISQGMELTIEVAAERYKIVDTPDGFQQIKMVDFGNLLVPGKPMLPVKVFMIALPLGAEVTNVNVNGINPVELIGTYRIVPAAMNMPSDHRHDLDKQSIREWQNNYNLTYSSDQTYPPKVGEYIGSGSLRKYTFVRVAFFPFSYQPKSGKLIFYPSAIISLNYSPSSLGSFDVQETQRLLSDTVADELASKLFVNYSQANDWYFSEGRDAEAMETYNYIVITTADLQNSVATLVSWKQDLGFSVKVVTTSWINNNLPGSDLQEKIRNFLKANYTAWGIEYVLLVGDITEIPMRICYPKPNDSQESTPTDYYYADLTGDWDSDHDNYYGEYGEDNVDFVPEVYVGRIPWSDVGTVSSICQKITDFEGDVGLWKNNALLLGAISNYANEDHNMGHNKTDGAELMREIISNLLGGWNYTTMYEKAGINPSPYSCNYPLTNANVISNWSSSSYGIVNWKAHGGRYDAWRKYWSWDDGDGVPETKSPDEMQWIPLLSTTDVNSLDDDHPSIIFACSCENGWPEANNLGKMLLKQGAVSIIASTRVSWYTIGWQDKDDGGNESIDYYFFHYLINDDKNVGSALFNSKIYYLNNFFWWDWESQQNMFTFCLYGDPALIRSGRAVARITVTSPNGGEVWHVGENRTISWTSQNTSGNVKIEYSFTSGISWTTIITSTPDDGSHPWIVPNTPSTNCFVRITDVDGTSSDQSDEPFTIEGTENLTLMSPNGGEVWQDGTSQSITWTSSGTSGNVRIEYSFNSGINWINIIDSTPDDGSHPWTVPNTTSTNCYVRITDIDGTPSDHSDGPFIIISKPDWIVPITITGGNPSYFLTFGGHASATNGFDSGLDILAAPPGMTYYTYFEISEFPNYLETDIREWITPYDTDIDWTLKIVNTRGITSTLSWNPVYIPTGSGIGTFNLVGPSLNVDMGSQGSAQVIGDATLLIQYRSGITMSYNFSQQGWYLISLPLTPPDNSLSALFPTAMAAFAYEAASGSYNSVTTLEPKKGYWLLMPSATSCTITGTALTTYTEHYNQGWHLIGSVADGTNFTDPKDNPNGSVIATYGWNSTTSQYFFVFPPGTGELKEKEGYWLAVAQPCDLIVGGSSLSKAMVASEVDMEAFYQRFGSQPPVAPYINDLSVAQSSQTSEEVILHNYPNPFNLETMIEYSVSKPGMTKIYIYNALGQRIRTLLEMQQQTGIHQVVWDGRNENGDFMNSGIYFCKIITLGFVKIMKMLLLK